MAAKNVGWGVGGGKVWGAINNQHSDMADIQLQQSCVATSHYCVIPTFLDMFIFNLIIYCGFTIVSTSISVPNPCANHTCQNGAECILTIQTDFGK